MKSFPIIDFFELPDFLALPRSSQLLFISLMCYYHERQRSRGRDIDDNIRADKAVFAICISRNEICQKFGFSKKRLLRSKADLKKAGVIIFSNRILSIGRSYKRKYGDNGLLSLLRSDGALNFGGTLEQDYCYMDGEFYKPLGGPMIDAEVGIRALDKKLLHHVDLEDTYRFTISANGRNIFNIPTKIFYSNTLTASEKMALFWKVIYELRLAKEVSDRFLAKVTCISERTIRNARKRYPRLKISQV